MKRREGKLISIEKLCEMSVNQSLNTLGKECTITEENITLQYHQTCTVHTPTNALFILKYTLIFTIKYI